MADGSSAPRVPLESVELFQGLRSDELAGVAAFFEPVELAAGAALFRQGEPGDAMYVLGAGSLLVQVELDGAVTTIDHLERGAVVGEMALLTNPLRSASVIAGAAGASVWRLARGAFERLTAAHPDLLGKVLEVARPRLERAQLAPLLREWFGAESEGEVAAWQARLRWRSVNQGEALYLAGEPAGSAFLVVTGSFELREPGPGRAEAPARRVGQAGILGEAAILQGGPRRRTAVALRDSQVVEVERSAAEGSPRFLMHLARALVERVYARSRAPADAVSTALLPAGPDAPMAAVADALERQLSAWGPVIVLSSALVDARFGRAGMAQSRPDDPLGPALASWLDQQQRAYAFVLLLLDPGPSAWTSRCLRQVDGVMIVAAADGDPTPSGLERDAAARAPGLPVELVLVHPDGRDSPSGTRRWLEPRSLHAHHHVRLGEPADVGRLARRLAGRAVGLALSGGGARGYVHLGLLRSIEEHGLPVDMVVGTSMGAVVGGSYALTLNAGACHELARTFGDSKKVLDYTLPLVALTRSRKVTLLLQEMLGSDRRIEDLWIPFACISASLTYSEPRVHRQGPLWRAVRASAAIPGVFTPVLSEDGDVLVDGGVMNNFPVDVLRGLLGAGSVIGSNAYGGREAHRTMSFGDDVSGWGLLAERLLPFGRRGRTRAPSMLGTLMRSTSLSSKHLMSAMDRYADLVVTYPTGGTSSLQFTGSADLIALGHERGGAALDEWLAGPDAPWRGAEAGGVRL